MGGTRHALRLRNLSISLWSYATLGYKTMIFGQEVVAVAQVWEVARVIQVLLELIRVNSWSIMTNMVIAANGNG